MPYFYVEGVYLPKSKRRRLNKPLSVSANELEPFGRGFWANSPDEALQLATQALEGGEWVNPPRISQTSEEKRMRQMGQPELPGLDTPEKPRHSKQANRRKNG